MVDVLWRRIKENWHLRNILPCIIIAAFAAVIFSMIYKNFYIASQQPAKITITAENHESHVTFRGASVDEQWYNPNDIVTDSQGWSYDDAEAVYTAEGKESLKIELPFGSERTLTFQSGPEEGVVLIEIDDEVLEFNLWSADIVENGLPYSLPVNQIPELIKEPLYTSLIFLLVFIVLLILSAKAEEIKTVSREVWMDLLRGICCFTVVLLHCTCNAFNEFKETMHAWYPHLIMNSFTAFAVPCFFMVSGASLLRREHGIKDTLRKRVAKIGIPLFFWSAVYILVDSDWKVEKFVDILFYAQTAHLWFLYSILGLYFLLPILSRLYNALDTNAKLYMITLLLFVPAVLHNIEHLFQHYIGTPQFAVFWPDLGLFFMGMFLWENREKLNRFIGYFPAMFLFGLLLTIGETLYVSLRDGVPNKNFISCIGSVGVLAMAIALFCWCMAWREKLQKIPEIYKKIVHMLGMVSFGIYLIHPLVMHIFHFRYSNTGTIFHMGIGACGYYAVCVLICWCGSRIRYVKKLF